MYALLDALGWLVRGVFVFGLTVAVIIAIYALRED